MAGLADAAWASIKSTANNTVSNFNKAQDDAATKSIADTVADLAKEGIKDATANQIQERIQENLPDNLKNSIPPDTLSEMVDRATDLYNAYDATKDLQQKQDNGTLTPQDVANDTSQLEDVVKSTWVKSFSGLDLILAETMGALALIIKEIDDKVHFENAFEKLMKAFENFDFDPFNSDKQPLPGSPANPFDPLVLDLNGDGVKLSRLGDSIAHYDFLGTGFAAQTGWVYGGDGLLMIDTGSGAKLVGVTSGDAFADLAAMDTNGDGQITAADAEFNDLYVWIDTDGDGVLDSGELHTLAAENITGLGIGYAAPGTGSSGDTVNPNGNIVNALGSFTVGSGPNAVTRSMASVDFLTSASNTTYVPPAGFMPSDSAMALPFLDGYGSVPDTLVSATNDPTLLAMMSDLVSNSATMSGDDFIAAMKSILYEWANVAAVDPESMGPNINAKDLGVLYRFYGAVSSGAMNFGTEPSVHAASVDEAEFNDILAREVVRFAAQIGASLLMQGTAITQVQANPFSIFSELNYDASSDTVTVDFKRLVEDAIANAPSDSGAAATYFSQIFPVIADLRSDIYADNVFQMTDDFIATALASGLAVSDLGAFLSHSGMTQIDESGSSGAISEGISTELVTLGSGDKSFSGPFSSDIVFYDAAGGNDTVNVPYGSVVLSGENLSDVDIYHVTGSSSYEISNRGLGTTLTLTSEPISLTFGNGEQLTDAGIAHVLAREAASYVSQNLTADASTQVSQLAQYGYGLFDDTDNTWSDSSATDVVFLGAGDKSVAAYDGNQVWVYTAGGGNDVINGGDVLFFANYNLSNLSLSYGGTSLRFSAGSDSVTFGGGETFTNGEVMFADGSLSTFKALVESEIVASETTGNDTIYGSPDSEVFDGKGGDDKIVGGGGNDTFVFNQGYGNLEISDSAQSAITSDVLSIGPGISPSDVTLKAGGTDLVDLLLEIGTSTITIDNFMYGIIDGVSLIEFADGTVWNRDVISQLLATGTSGDDYLVGLGGESVTFDGHGGHDVEQSSGNSDTYIFKSGYGFLDAKTASTGGVIEIEGISPNEITVYNNSQQFYPEWMLVDALTGDVIEIDGSFDEIKFFDDGTVWNPAAFGANIFGSYRIGTTGDETLGGFANSDTIDGRGGNDYEIGGGGGDTFIFDAGYGSLTIYETDKALVSSNKLALGPGISQSDVIVHASGEDLLLSIGNNGDNVRIRNFLESEVVTDGVIRNGIDEVVFSDGSVWSRQDLLARLADDAGVGTVNGDSLTGTPTAETFDGKGGGDVIHGGGGGDTIIFRQGYGFLEVDEPDDLTHTNRLELGAGINPSDVIVQYDSSGNILLTVDTEADKIQIDGMYFDHQRGVQEVDFADGTVWTSQNIVEKATQVPSIIQGTVGDDQLYGGGADTFDGLGGSDYEQGQGNGDRFIFNIGYGALEIQEYGTLNQDNRLVFGAGITPDEVTRSSDGQGDVILTVGVDGDQVKLDQQDEGAFGITEVDFANGAKWTSGDLHVTDLNATTGEDVLIGSSVGETIDGLGGGDDFAVGYGGGDTFIFNAGYGELDIQESDQSPVANNKLAFGTGIITSDVTVRSDDSGGLVLSIGTSGDIVYLYGEADDPMQGVQAVQFADGTVWDRVTLLGLVQPTIVTGTSGEDQLYGTQGGDVFDGLGGNDFEEGGGGGDIFKYDPGYGRLEISEEEWDGKINKLVFGAGTSPTDVVVTHTGDGSIVLALGGNGDAVRLDNMAMDSNAGVQEVDFADGTIWTAADVLSRISNASEILGSPSSDNLIGTSAGETFDGDGGNDSIIGGGGGDTFIYRVGYGNIEIDEVWPAGSMENTLELGAGITSADIIVTAQVHDEPSSGQLDAIDLILSDGVAGDQVVLDSELSDPARGVQQVVLSDGTILTRADLVARELAGDGGDNNIFGTTGADVLDGKGGGDKVTGGGGGDNFIFDAGYGHLEINEQDTSASPHNIVTFGAGIAADQIIASRDGNNLVLSIGVSGDQVTLDGMYGAGSKNNGVQSLQFSDTTVVSTSALIAETEAGTSGSDNIIGTERADTFDGLGGGDTISGFGGGDLLTYQEGYGALTINEVESGSASNILRFGPGITANSLTFTKYSGNVLIADGVGGDQVTLEDMLDGRAFGIQGIQFSDGTTMSRTEILSAAVASGASSGLLSGTTESEVFRGGTPNGFGNYVQYNGNGGDDTYMFSSSIPMLQIDNTSTVDTHAHGKLVFSEGVTENDLWFMRSYGGLEIDVLGPNGVTNSVVISDWFMGDPSAPLTEIQLANGMAITKSSIDALASTMTSSYLEDGGVRSVGDQTVAAAIANAWQRAPTIIGTAGTDTLSGTSGTDVFDGFGGADVETGYGGDDTFCFNTGYGHLEIDETDSNTAANNVLSLGTGITPNAVFVSSDGAGDLLLTDGVTGDQVKLDGEVYSGQNGVQTVRFADGTTWSRQQMLDAGIIGTSGSDNVTGTNGADIIDGKGGNDFVTGNGGDDTFFYNSGYGVLEIAEYDDSANPNNVLVLGPGINPDDLSVWNDGYGAFNIYDNVTGDNVLLDAEIYGPQNGVQQIRFANGTIWTRQHLMDSGIVGTSGNDSLTGTSGNDIIDGKGGTDYVNGGGGNDTFFMNAGYGTLEIYQYESGIVGNNQLVMGAGIDPSDISVRADGYGDIVLYDNATGDTVLLDTEVNSSFGGVQKVIFSDDGTVWTRQDLLSKGIVGTSGNDTLTGTSAAEWFEGNGGVDTINGGGGNDIYMFKPGDGQVTINNAGGSSPHGSLEFDESITDEDLWFKHTGNNLVIQRIDSSDTVTIQNWFGSNSGAKLSEITLNGDIEVDSQLNNLISAMATYSSHNSSFNPATATAMPTDSTLQASIASSWHG